MTIFAYIVALFTLPVALIHGGQFAVSNGVPISLCIAVGCIVTCCFSWHCAMRLTAGRNW